MAKTATMVAVVLMVAVACDSGLLGGRTEVRNVRSDREVQDLGRFSVEEYKKEQGGSNAAVGKMEFSEVVAAEKQLVEGIKYYMKVEVAITGQKQVFDSEVVVVPWQGSKRLLSFAPSSKTTT